MHVKDELLQCPVQHRPAPRHRLVTFEEHTDGNHLDEPARRAAAHLPVLPGRIHCGRDNQVIQAGGCLVNAQ